MIWRKGECPGMVGTHRLLRGLGRRAWDEKMSYM